MVTRSTVRISTGQIAGLPIILNARTIQVMSSLAASLAIGHNHVMLQLRRARFERSRVPSATLSAQGRDAVPSSLVIRDTNANLRTLAIISVYNCIR